MDSMKPYRPRTFLPGDWSLEGWEDVQPHVDRLIGAIQESNGTCELEEVVFHWDELSAALSEVGARRYIRMTCDTNDERAEQAYLDFVHRIKPSLKQARRNIYRTLVDHPDVGALERNGHEVFFRSVRNELDLFREQNVPLETEVEEKSQQYQKIMGSVTVPFENEEYTIKQMGRFLEEPDRERRRMAWTARSQARLEQRERLNDLFGELTELRETIASNAGFASVREYMFRRHERFDYDPEDCRDYHAAVKEYLLPLKRRLQRIRRQRMGHSSLRPWDLDVDPEGRNPLRPFDDAEQLVEQVQQLLRAVDPTFGEHLNRLRNHDLLDLENRPGKAPGGYQRLLDEVRLPFIFMNAVGMHNDLKTLLHEAGHAVHSLTCRDLPLTHDLHPPLEFAEVASMSMECFGGEHLDRIYEPEDRRRIAYETLESTVSLLCWVSQVDEFQHRFYTENVESAESLWEQLGKEYGDEVEWNGFETSRRSRWHRQLHIFQYPFYYIEYGIAQLGSLQLWERYRDDPEQALKSFRKALSRGGSRPLPELFEAAGLPFSFGEETVRPMAEFLRGEVHRLRSSP